MNCSALCTAPLSSRYFSLRSRCTFASAAGYQVPLRLNVHDEASSLDSRASISARAAGESYAAVPARAKLTASRKSKSRCMSPAARLEHPVDREDRQHVDAPAPEPGRSRLGVVARFTCRGPLD